MQGGGCSTIGMEGLNLFGWKNMQSHACVITDVVWVYYARVTLLLCIPSINLSCTPTSSFVCSKASLISSEYKEFNEMYSTAGFLAS